MGLKSTKEIVTQLRKFFDPSLLYSHRVEIRGDSIVLFERSNNAKLKKLIIKDIPVSSENIVPFHVSKDTVYFFKNKDNCETAILLLFENNGNHQLYIILPEMKSSIKKYKKAIKQIINTALFVVMILRFIEVDVLDNTVVRWYGVVGIKLDTIDMDTIVLSRTAKNIKNVADNESKLFEKLIKREELSVELPWNNSLTIIKKGFVSESDTVEFSIKELI